jgi:hypothetical protein
MLDVIRDRISQRQYEFSRHAVDQSVIRDIGIHELEEAVSNQSEIIEDYPEDKYNPSCLILGFTNAGRPIHVQCSYPTRAVIKVITLYEPDPALWTDHRVRKTD